MAETNDELPAGVITTAQAAKLLMVSEAWLGRLAKEGYIQKLDRGRWNLVSVVQGHIRFLKDEERRNSKSARPHADPGHPGRASRPAAAGRAPRARSAG